MDIWQGLLLGLIQGATEFLPISSSGHLFLAETWLGLEPNLSFAVLAHGASLLAVVILYRQDLWKMIRGAFFSRSAWGAGYKKEGQLAWKLVLATGLTVGVALLIEPYFETFLSLPWVASTLIITGLLIVVAEKFRPKKELAFTWTLAIVLGLVQGIAVIPGLSRSGLTIALLIWLGLSRGQSLRISFLLSIPTIFGALVFMVKDQWGQLDWSAGALLGLGVAFATAWLAIIGMQHLVQRHWLWFAPYCFAVGGGILVWLYLW